MIKNVWSKSDHIKIHKERVLRSNATNSKTMIIKSPCPVYIITSYWWVNLFEKLGLPFLVFGPLTTAKKGTVKPVYNGHPQYPKFVAVVDRWSLFRGIWCVDLNCDSKMVVAVGGWSLTQDWLYFENRLKNPSWIII